MSKKKKSKKWFGDRCPNCKEYGSHYVPPSCGDPGFFICKSKQEQEAIDQEVMRRDSEREIYKECDEEDRREYE